MTDYVLVHGAWGGGWAYDRLSADLRAHGHRVVVAALTGLGTRANELHPAIDLSTHIGDVCAQVEAAGFGLLAAWGVAETVHPRLQDWQHRGQLLSIAFPLTRPVGIESTGDLGRARGGDGPRP